MMGVLGIGSNLRHWNSEQLEESKALISLYKEIRPLVQKGNLYKLSSPRKNSFSAAEYVNKAGTEAVVFAFSIPGPLTEQSPILCLRGLIPDKAYQVDGVDRPVSGQYLMSQGIKLSFSQSIDSLLIRVRQLS
jgi:alpha-galactosidase